MIKDVMGFALDWADAWNRRDVEAVLQHFAEDAVFISPVAQRIGFADDGTVRGKDALRRYWIAALEVNPRLHFEVTAAYAGIDTVVIAYRNQDGTDRAESLTFRNDRVVEGRGMFAAAR